MKTKILFKICFLALLSVLSSKSYGKIVWRSLPRLVHEAPVISKGKISIQNDTIILNVEKTLKGQEYTQITILYIKYPEFEAALPKFKDGEETLLFLDPEPYEPVFNIVEKLNKGEMYLFGLGDQAKWPRVYPEKPKGSEYYHHYPKLQDTASLEAIQGVVEKLLEIEKIQDLDKKTILCAEYIKSTNRLLQSTALEYAVHGYFWAPPIGESRGAIPKEVSVQRTSIMKKLASEVLSLSLVDSNEPSISEEAIRFMIYVEPEKAMPLLISKITDEDKGVRTATHTAINTIANNLKIKESFVKYEHDDSMENLKAIQQKWKNWFNENKDKLSKKN